MSKRPVTSLCLSVSLLNEKRFDGITTNTYRAEGITLSSYKLRLFGQEILVETMYEHLNIGKRIGQGACSSVNIAQSRVTGANYAVKMFNVYDDNQDAQLFREISLLANVQCDALISLKGAFYQQGSIGIILEYMDKGSLDYLMEENICVNETALAAITYQMLWGLGYLHFENKLHRDIKPANVLINSKGQVKLSDFGISTALQDSQAMSTTHVGTFRYMAPERLLGQGYDSSSDIWSLGLMIVQLWQKLYPFEDCAFSPIDLLSELENIDMQKLLTPEKYSPHFREFLLATLALNQSDRPSCAELMEAPWLVENAVQDLIASRQIVADWLLSCESPVVAAHRHARDNRASAPFSSNISPSGNARERVAARKDHHVTAEPNWGEDSGAMVTTASVQYTQPAQHKSSYSDDEADLYADDRFETYEEPCDAKSRGRGHKN